MMGGRCLTVTKGMSMKLFSDPNGTYLTITLMSRPGKGASLILTWTKGRTGSQCLE